MNSKSLLDTMIAQSKLSKKNTERQQRIVEAAIKIFAEKGFANTSTSEIANLAGVAEATIFRHYGNKDNLLLSIILPFLKDFTPFMVEELFHELMSENPATFEEFLRGFIKNRLHFINENKELFQILVKEILYSQELKQEFQPLFAENILQHFIKVIDIFKQRGEIINLPNSFLLRMLLNFISGYFISRFIFLPKNFVKNEEEELDNLIYFIMDGLRKHV